MQYVPENYGYVVGVVGLSHFMNFFLIMKVVKARKQYNVQYPALYAPESHNNAKEFNCIQRAHQNTLENWSPIMILMMLNGLVYPKLSAAFGLVWVLGRILYGIGYGKKGPKGRMAGGLISHLGDFPLIIMTFITATKMNKL